MNVKEWEENWDGKTFSDDYGILNQKTTNGIKIALLQFQKGYITEDPRILSISCVHDYRIAHYQANDGWSTDNRKVLTLKTFLDESVAYMQVINGWTTECPELLSTVNTSNRTPLAMTQAEMGWTTEDPQILQLINLKGTTVAETQIENGWKPPKHLQALKIYKNYTMKTVSLHQLYKEVNKQKL
jgi:hypothetical protein